jgi:hypothetical protein
MKLDYLEDEVSRRIYCGVEPKVAIDEVFDAHEVRCYDVLAACKNEEKGLVTSVLRLSVSRREKMLEDYCS